MALSNIFREPRREITEQLAGLAVLTIPFLFIYYLACLLYDGKEPFAICLFLGFILVAAGGLVISGLLFFMHAVGEWICGVLADRGLEIRPKRRY